MHVVSVTFSESVDPTTLAAGIQMTAGTNPVAGSVSLRRGQPEWRPSPRRRLLASQTLYTVTVAGVKDLAGNTMTAAFTSTFTTTTILFSDSFESGTANWTLTPPWGLTTSSYVSPTHSLTDSPAGNYAPNLEHLGHQCRHQRHEHRVGIPELLAERTNPSRTRDFLWVEYSTNGANWTTLTNWSGTLDWAQHTHTIAAALWHDQIADPFPLHLERQRSRSTACTWTT